MAVDVRIRRAKIISSSLEPLQRRGLIGHQHSLQYLAIERHPGVAMATKLQEDNCIGFDTKRALVPTPNKASKSNACSLQVSVAICRRRRSADTGKPFSR